MALIDRARETQAIDALLESARHQAGGALVLRGERGIGLTALLDYAAAAATGMWVLRVSGIAAEAQVAYGAVHRLLAPEMWRHRLHLPVPQRAALDRVFGLEAPLPAAAGEVDPLLVGLGVLTLLARAAEDRPVLCSVDDAQELDGQSALALTLVARRLAVDPIAVLFARHDPSETRDVFGDLDELVVSGLADTDARVLIDSVLGHRLDARTREQILAETAGNPSAIIELPALLPESATPSLADPLPLAYRLERHYVQQLRGLSPKAREFLLLAAVLNGGSATLFWSTSEILGLESDARREAENAGVLQSGLNVGFRSSLFRSAVYGTATPDERRRVHLALGQAADAAGDEVRAAWHHSAASPGPNEETAAALVAAASLVRRHGDATTAAVLVERASSLTPDAAVHAARLLLAAEDQLAAGSPGRAAALVAETTAFPLTLLERAQAAMLRAQAARNLGDGGDSATMLLRAAEQIAAQDEELGRRSLLEALEAAVYGGRPGSGGQVLETSRAALAHAPGSPEAAPDLLLRGLSLLFTDGHEAALPTLRRALEALRAGTDRRWLTLGGFAALELWDDRALQELAAVDAGLGGGMRLAPVNLHLRYLAGLDHIIAGRFAEADEHYSDTRMLAELAREPAIADIANAGSVMVQAWRAQRGRAETSALIDQRGRDAMAAELGRYYALTRYALAVLENGSGHYPEALHAAQETVEERGLYLATFALPELVEAAVRTGERELASGALAELELRTVPSSTSWALGMLARSRALLAKGEDAEALYVEAIERLSECRARPQLARAHLLYGEWLRRRRRRRNAREQLRLAETMFVAMGAELFAARARGELAAAGEGPRPAQRQRAEALTAQQARIASLVIEGASSPEIGAQLYISPRTVEYHLHKIFRKLSVFSRVELVRAMITAAGDDEASDSAP